MAKEKKQEPNLILEREYIVPLRKGWLKVPGYKRTNKAVKTLKEFLVRHMKVYDKDLRKIKIDINLNNEIRFRGMKKPPAKIKIKARKFDNQTVKVELVDIPEIIRFKKLREEKKKFIEKKEDKKEEKVEEKKEESVETKEKESSAREENLMLAKEKARELKHVSKDKKVQVHRMALEK